MPSRISFWARRIGGLASRVRPLRATIRPRVRHIVYCPECHSGISAMPPRPARFGLNADVAHTAIKKTAATSLPPLPFLLFQGNMIARSFISSLYVQQY